MSSDFNLKCTAVPNQDGPLIPRFAEAGSFVSLHVNDGAPCPKSLNIDSLLIFDMQADGGLDAIEIIARMDTVLEPGYIFPRWGEERYWRLFLETNREFVGEPDIIVSMEWADHILTCRWTDQAADTKYLLGPGITAFVGRGQLLGFQTDLSGLLKR